MLRLDESKSTTKSTRIPQHVTTQHDYSVGHTGVCGYHDDEATFLVCIGLCPWWVGWVHQQPRFLGQIGLV